MWVHQQKTKIKDIFVSAFLSAYTFTVWDISDEHGQNTPNNQWWGDQPTENGSELQFTGRNSLDVNALDNELQNSVFLEESSGGPSRSLDETIDCSGKSPIISEIRRSSISIIISSCHDRINTQKQSTQAQSQDRTLFCIFIWLSLIHI